MFGSLGSSYGPHTGPYEGYSVDPVLFGARSVATDPNFDSTAAIQAAIDAWPCVELPANTTFRLSGRLIIPSDKTLRGQGSSSELFFDWVGRDQGFTEYIRNETQSSGAVTTDKNIVLQNFKVRGAGDGLPYGSPIPGNTGTTVSGVLMRRVKDLVIDGLEITKVTGISIAHQGCTGARIVNNRIYDVGRDGITGCWWVDRCEDIVIQGNRITNNGDDGIAIISSEDQPNDDVRPRRISIVGNVIKTRDDYLGSTETVTVTSGSSVVTSSGTPFTSADVGKRIVIAGAGASGADMTGYIASVDSSSQITVDFQAVTSTASAIAKYSNVAGRGILCIGGEDITISGNVINKTAMTGILVYSDQDAESSLFRPQRIAITGNTINDAGRSGDDTQPGNGIRMSNCDDSTISGNTVNNSRESGIYVSDCLSPVINGNAVAACGSSCVAGKFHYGIEIYGNPASYNVFGPSIAGNTVRGCAAGGIFNGFSRHAAVTGNVCVDNGALGNGTRHEASGIIHQGNGEGAYSGNTCADYKSSGKLQVFGFAYIAGYDGAKITLSANILANNKTYGINLTANPSYIAMSGNYSPEGFNIGGLTNTVACIKRGNIESATAANNFDRDAGGTTHRTGSGAPEGAIAATIGSTYRRTDGGAATAFYVKESGTGNTGWAAK